MTQRNKIFQRKIFNEKRKKYLERETKLQKIIEGERFQRENNWNDTKILNEKMLGE